MGLRITYCLFFLLFSSSITLATPLNTDKILALQNLAIEKSLWQHQEWLNLIHYYKKSAYSEEYYSHADDNVFFIAENGASNPKSELLSTIAALYRTDLTNDDHAQCRFIARFAWLTKHLSIDAGSLPSVSCQKFNTWYSMIQPQRVTMVFPTYHLNSPSSMFGHTLLRLDRSIEKEQSKLLSFAVNFGANTDSNDNSIFYAYKGLTGAYPGLFNVTPYYNKIREYNRIEKRDIWEYNLNLTPIEAERMTKHLWELQDINFNYYFFDENCSYRLLELLEVARPGLELTDDFGLTAIPVDTIKTIEQAGLIASHQYRPSQVTELNTLLKLMSESELDLMEEISKNPSRTNQADFLTKPEDKQRNIVDTAYRYLRYQEVGKVKNKETAKHSFQLLTALNKYPSNSFKPLITPPIRPEKGHHSRRITIGMKERNEKLYSTLSLRMAFHSLEDNLHGYLPGAQINITNIQMRVLNSTGDIQLDKLDVIDILSLNPRTRFFKSFSWQVLTGFERQTIDRKDKLVAHLSGGGGYTYSVFKKGFLYSLGTARLERAKETQSYIIEPALGISNGFLWHFNSSTAKIEIRAEKFLNGNYRSQINYTHNFALTRNQSLKVSGGGEKHSANSFINASINYQYYF